MLKLKAQRAKQSLINKRTKKKKHTQKTMQPPTYRPLNQKSHQAKQRITTSQQQPDHEPSLNKSLTTSSTKNKTPTTEKHCYFIYPTRY